MITPALGAARARGRRMLGKGRRGSTPPEIIGPLEAEFHFTLDPCAEPQTAKASRFYTEADDGLAHSWVGERVYMNPPYGPEISAWTAKARSEAAAGSLVVGLLPASVDLEWWHRDVLGAGAEVRYLRGRVRYMDPDGSGLRYRPSFASVVVIWRPPRDSQPTPDIT